MTKSDEAARILLKTDGRGALENPDIMGAEGARGYHPESLRQKDRAVYFML